MVVDGLAFVQIRTCKLGDGVRLVVFVCTLKGKAAEAAHAWRGHDRGRNYVQLAFGTLGQIDHVRMVLNMVGDDMAVAVLALVETVELDLCLMISNRGILDASDSVALLLCHVEQDKGIPGRLKGIKVRPVSYLALKVLVASPHDGGERLVQAGGAVHLLKYHLLEFDLTPVLGALRIIGHVLVAWLGRMIKDLRLTIINGLTCVMAVLESGVS